MVMHESTWLLAGPLWLALWPGAARGQSAELQEAYDLFELLYDKDYYEEAHPYAKQALRLGNQEFGPDHPITATAMDMWIDLFPRI